MYNSHPSLPPSLPRSLPPPSLPLSFPSNFKQIHCPFQPKQSPIYEDVPMSREDVHVTSNVELRNYVKLLLNAELRNYVISRQIVERRVTQLRNITSSYVIT